MNAMKAEMIDAMKRILRHISCPLYTLSTSELQAAERFTARLASCRASSYRTDSSMRLLKRDNNGQKEELQVRLGLDSMFQINSMMSVLVNAGETRGLEGSAGTEKPYFWYGVR